MSDFNTKQEVIDAKKYFGYDQKPHSGNGYDFEINGIKYEHKTEDYDRWGRKGNFFCEVYQGYEDSTYNPKRPSGLFVTQADFYFINLRMEDNSEISPIIVSVDKLKRIVKDMEERFIEPKMAPHILGNDPSYQTTYGYLIPITELVPNEKHLFWKDDKEIKNRLKELTNERKRLQ